MRSWVVLIAAGCAFDPGGTSSTSIDAVPATDGFVARDAAPADSLTPDARPPDVPPPDAAPDSGCPQGCMPGSDPCCPLDCAPAQSCGSSSGGMHYFRCTGQDCNVVCSGNSNCSVDCAGATGQCGLSCSGSQASCSLYCHNATDCPLSCNPQSVLLCGTDLKVCGRACP